MSRIWVSMVQEILAFQNSDLVVSSLSLFSSRLYLWRHHYCQIRFAFGRRTPDKPDATQDKVPCTNLAFLDNEPRSEYTLHPGYIITAAGIEIGLINDNTQGFSTTQLELTPGTPLSRREWADAEITLVMDSSDWNRGTALFDSDLAPSYIRFDALTTAQLHTTTLTENNFTYTVLSTIKRQIGKAPADIASYKVRVD